MSRGKEASIRAWPVRAVKIATVTTTAGCYGNLCSYYNLALAKKSVQRLQFPGPKDCDSKNYLDAILGLCQESPFDYYWLLF